MTDEQRIEHAAKRLWAARQIVMRYEGELQRVVGEIVGKNKNGLRDWARQMGISAQYACDIRHGRRKISDRILNAFLKEETK